MYDFDFTYALTLALIMQSLVGALIGQTKNRLVAGLLFGLCLSWIGWLIVALGPNYKPKCPECKGVIIPNATRCKNCGCTLAPPKNPRTRVR